MGAASLSVVADTGPLLHLFEIDCLAVLSVFDRLHIPAAVWQECQRQGQAFQSALATVRHIQRHAVPHAMLTTFIQTHALTELHFGERECF